MDVKLIRMATGEDLIAEIVEHDEAGIKLKNPCIVLIQPTETSRANINITHWVPYAADKDFIINNQHVIFMIDPADDLLNNYKAAFSPLILAKSQDIIRAVK